MSFSDYFVSKYINKAKESQDDVISASLIPPKIDLLEIKNEIDIQPWSSSYSGIQIEPTETTDIIEEESENNDINKDKNKDKTTSDVEWVVESKTNTVKETTKENTIEEKETKQTKEGSSYKVKPNAIGRIVQKQRITPGRIAWASNNVEWRKGILSHNDKLPPDNNIILSPVNGVVVGVKNNYKENKKSRSLSKPSFGNYIVIKITDGPFSWLTYHLGHIDKNIPLNIWAKVTVWTPIGYIHHGSGSGTGRHYSDAIWEPDATDMSYKHHTSYTEQTAQLANLTITDQKTVVFHDGSSHNSSSIA